MPAGGQASVDVRSTRRSPAPGAYSGVVTATPSGGGQTVRTAFGYVLEGERYDVTVEVTPRAGTQSASHTVSLAGLDDYALDAADAGRGARPQRSPSASPPGRYGASVVSFGTAADDSQDRRARHQAELSRSSATPPSPWTRTQTRLFDYTTDKPVVNDGAIINVQLGRA